MIRMAWLFFEIFQQMQYITAALPHISMQYDIYG